ncbi:hypothetical protein GN956_G18889 [Arapaima gigas]
MQVLECSQNAMGVSCGLPQAPHSAVCLSAGGFMDTQAKGSQSGAVSPFSFAYPMVPSDMTAVSSMYKNTAQTQTGAEMSNHTVEQNPLWMVGVYSAAEVLMGVLACAGNMLVCWVFARTSVPWVPTHYFVVSQAGADAGVGCLAVPFSIAVAFQVHLGWHMCRFLSMFILLLTQTSIFSLLAIAVDRSLFIRVPLRYPDLMRTSRVKIIIVGLWLFSFLVVLLPYLLWPEHSETNQDTTKVRHTAPHLLGPPDRGEENAAPASVVKVGGSGQSCRRMVPCIFEDVMDMAFMVYYVFLGCVLPPLLLMLLLYSCIFAVARRHLVREQRAMGDHTSSLLSRELHAARPLAAAVGVSYLCWLPVHIRNMLTLLRPHLKTPPWLTLATIALSHANSVFNPLLYALKLREFRQAMLSTLCPQRPMRGRNPALDTHHTCVSVTCMCSEDTRDTHNTSNSRSSNLSPV